MWKDKNWTSIKYSSENKYKQRQLQCAMIVRVSKNIFCLIGCFSLYMYEQTSSRLDGLCFKEVFFFFTGSEITLLQSLPFTSKPFNKEFFLSVQSDAFKVIKCLATMHFVRFVCALNILNHLHLIT